jgi:outer membrane immunogenic protein
MKLPRSAAVLLLLASISGVASAQGVITTSSGNRWEGWYAGVNLGGAWNTTCNTWTANTAAQQNFLNARSCPNGGTFIGGLQGGYNFQYEQWVWGLGIDYDFISSKSKYQNYTVPAVPGTGINGGTVSISGKTSPNGALILGPRVGYDFDGWLPFIRAGGVFTSGSPTVSADYTDRVNGPFYFNGGKNAKNNGWGIGGGLDWMAQDPFSFRLEYTYVNINKSSSSTAFCQTNFAGGCSVFNNVTIQNFHNSLTFSLVRLEANYKF